MDVLDTSRLGMKVGDDDRLILKRRDDPVEHLVLRRWNNQGETVQEALWVIELSYKGVRSRVLLLPSIGRGTLPFTGRSHNSLGSRKGSREGGVGDDDIMGGVTSVIGHLGHHKQHQLSLIHI